MNRRAFITALSALPAVALFPGLLRAAPKPVVPRLLEMYRAMASFGDRPDALFMSPDRMWRTAQLFQVEPMWDEFEHPWGGDICGTPGLGDHEIQVAAGLGLRKPGDKFNRSTLYFFDWEKDSFVRHQAGHLAVSHKFSEVLSRSLG